jgi:hypothetical protein
VRGGEVLDLWGVRMRELGWGRWVVWDGDGDWEGWM